MKPKKQYKKASGAGYDQCQTPPYAVEPLIHPLKAAGFNAIWEPAMGEGLLSDELSHQGFKVLGTDIIWGTDYFTAEPWTDYDCIVTNPPYSIKYDWIERSYELNRAWALLLPVETIGAYAAQKLFQAHDTGIQIIYVSPRIDFKMPNAGWSGKGAQFPTAWYTWGFNLPQDISYYRLTKVKYE